MKQYYKYGWFWKKCSNYFINFARNKIKRIKNLNSFLRGLQNSIKSYFILYNAKSLLKDLYETIKKDIEENNGKSSDLMAGIKDYILKNRSSSKIVDMTYKKLVEIITNIFGNENMEWTKLPYYDIPLECLLFFYQYKDI